MAACIKAASFKTACPKDKCGDRRRKSLRGLTSKSVLTLKVATPLDAAVRAATADVGAAAAVYPLFYLRIHRKSGGNSPPARVQIIYQNLQGEG
jgi:hypothetical protein